MDLKSLRNEFSVTQNYNFLNHASVSPLPKSTVAAINEYLQNFQASSYVRDNGNKRYEQVRTLAADLIGAHSDEIAFVKNTSEGISFVANGLKWNAGDNIVTTAVEFPSNMYPWMNLQSRGVQIRTILEESGRIPIENLIDAIDSHTRVVTVSSVQYASGFRLDLAELGTWCQKRGVLFCVDAIQSLGALPLDVQEMGIDLLSCGAQKWLCGPEGIGIFYCNRELLGFMNPSTIGWRSVKNAEDFGHYDLDFRDDARRFESGSYNLAGVYGMGASMQLLMDVGINNIESHVLALTDQLVAGLRERGYRVVSPRGETEKSSIVSFTSPRHDLLQLQHHLETEHRIITSVREGRLRVSPHLYNTEDEIDHLLEVLPRH